MWIVYACKENHEELFWGDMRSFWVITGLVKFFDTEEEARYTARDMRDIRYIIVVKEITSGSTINADTPHEE